MAQKDGTVVVSSKVPTATRRLAEAAAQVEGVTLSRFTALALQEAAARRLLPGAEAQNAAAAARD